MKHLILSSIISLVGCWTVSAQNIFPSNGSVGIGTTSPQQKLVVSNNNAEGLEVYLQQPVGTVGLQSYNRAINAYSKMQLNASQFSFMYGNMGIGTINPFRKLHILGNGSNFGQWIENTGTGGSETSRLSFKVAPGGVDPRAGVLEWYEGDVFKGDLRMHRSGGIQIRNSDDNPVFDILNNGNVGIGITIPQNKLHSVSLGNTGHASALIHGQYYGLYTSTQATSSNYYAFVVESGSNQNGSGGIPRFYVRADGNVGIGTNSPSTKLHIADGNNYVRIGDINGFSTPVIELADGAPVQIEGYESHLRFLTSGAEHLRITSDGNIGIGTTETKGYKLAVNGPAIFTKAVVKQYNNWPDYVFSSSYKLLSLREVEAFIKQHKHLPDVPTAKEVEKNGLDLGDNQAVLLKKIEELTLYAICADKKNEEQQKEIKELKRSNSILEQQIELIYKLQNEIELLKKSNSKH